MRGKRIQTLYKEMYNLIKSKGISDVILNTYPDSLDTGGDKYVVVELPYSLRDIDISNYDVKTSYARFTFFAKDKVYKTSRMPDIVAIETMLDAFTGIFPYVGTNYSMMNPRAVIMPKRADAHYHYAIVNVPVIFN